MAERAGIRPSQPRPILHRRPWHCNTFRCLGYQRKSSRLCISHVIVTNYHKPTQEVHRVRGFPSRTKQVFAGCKMHPWVTALTTPLMCMILGSVHPDFNAAISHLATTRLTTGVTARFRCASTASKQRPLVETFLQHCSRSRFLKLRVGNGESLGILVP